MLVADAQTASLRLDFDRTKETMGATFRLVPRKDTALAAEIARSTAGQGVGAAFPCRRPRPSSPPTCRFPIP